MSYQFIYYKKDFEGYYNHVLQPLSQCLNPEWAHKLGVSALKYGLFPSENYQDPTVLVCLKIISRIKLKNQLFLQLWIYY